jgi:hypothetical protein
LLASACGAGGGTSSSTAQSLSDRPIPQSDLQIAELLYTDSARTPPGFVQEIPRPDLASAATFHLKSTDLDATAATDFELCSDDFAQALTWDEIAPRAGAARADLVETSDTATYFELVRATRSTPIEMLRARVFKCAYLDRADSDLQLANGPAGALNMRPIDASTLQHVAEYLWQFTRFNNFGHVVLKSSGSDLGAVLRQSIYIANLQSATDGGCDHIDVLEWQHDADKQSGQLHRRELALWSFKARRSYDRPELCS